MTLDREGALRIKGGANDTLEPIEAAMRDLPGQRAGIRLGCLGDLSGVVGPDGTIGRLVAAATGRWSRQVRAILFDKTAANNWRLGWHQDRTIHVAERREVPGYGA